jgi:YVTN family beta-propeller protein
MKTSRGRLQLRYSTRQSSRLRTRVSCGSVALALAASLVPAVALVAAVPGTALAASPGQQEVYVLTEDDSPEITGLTALSAASPATQEFQVNLAASTTGTGDNLVVSPDSATAYIGSTSLPAARVNTLQGTEEPHLSYSNATASYGDMAMSPDGSILYIPTFLGINEYHPATGVLTKSAIPTPGSGSQPFGVAVSPDGSTLYVAGNASNDVYAVKASTGAVLATIPAGSAPNALLLSPDGSRLYVSNNQAGTISVIDTASDTNIATITIPGGPHGAPTAMNIPQTTCISPDGSTLYVPGPPGGPVSVVSTATDTVTGAINPPGGPGPGAIASNSWACAVSPDGSQLWVAYDNLIEQLGGVAVYSTSPGHALLGENTAASVQNAVQIAFGPDQAPNAALSVTPGPEFQSTQFDASASTVPYGTITNYAWDFGDGTTASTSTPTTSHVYTTPGPFTAAVTETDSAGTSTSTLSIGTEDLRNGGPQARASQTVTPLPPGPATLSGVVSTPGSPDCTQNPGDGTSPLAGATVTLLAPDGSVLDSATAGNSGNFSLNGRYEPGQQVQISGSNLNPAVPGQFDLASGGLSMTGDTIQNLTLPNPVLVNVSVTDTTGHPVPGATVGEAAADPTAPFALFPGATAQPGTQSAAPQTTGATGQATLCLYPAPAAHLTAASGARQGTAVTDTSTGAATIQIPTLPSVSLSSSLPTSQYAQPVTLTATAGPNGSGGPIPGGTVTFSVDGTAQPPVTLSSGQATLTLSHLSGGAHTITAAYSGDSVYAAGTSAPLTQTVLPDSTTTMLSSTAQPSVTGQAGSITARVASGPGQGTPTGSATFVVDGSARPPATLRQGKASMKLAGLAAGTHSIAVIYSGDTNHSASTSAAFTQVVNPAATSASLSTTATPSVYGQSGAVTVKVKPNPPGTGTPAGAVTFSVDGVAGAPVALSGGKAAMPLAGLGAGSHQITATYSGDANYLGGTSPALSQVVNKAGTTTKLTSSANPVQQGGAGSITAAVKDVLPATGVATGTIRFTVDGVARRPVALSSLGVARLRLASLAVGTHTITATYSGDANHLASTSAQLTEVVTGAGPAAGAFTGSGARFILRH